jgi:hypothetical protein
MKGITFSGIIYVPGGSGVAYTAGSVYLSNVAAFSTKSLSAIGSNMYGVDGNLYVDAQLFFDYYGQIEFIDHFMMAALTGTTTTHGKGNINFVGKHIGRICKQIKIRVT